MTKNLTVEQIKAILDSGNFDAFITAVEDEQIERGGCRVKTEASDVDATLQGRWGKVVATLGRNDEWLS